MNITRVLAGLFYLVCLSTSVFAQIQPGRAVQISISGVPSEEKSRFDPVYPVSQSGTINMPFIGQVQASGMRAEQLAAILEQRYKAAEIYTHPTFQVIDSTTQRVDEQTVTLGGQIRSPGPKPWNRSLTLWQAIQAAGGPTEFGSMKRVKLYRGKVVKQYDVTKTQFMQIPLEPDDTIEIPEKNIWNG